MFDAPAIIKNIPDIAKIYEINDRQELELDAALDVLDSNILIDTMDASMAGKWERILGLTGSADAALPDRRARVKAKILERLPYSYRVIVGKLQGMCSELYDVQLDETRTDLLVLALFTSEYQVEITEEMLDRCLPLNVFYTIRNHRKREMREIVRIGGAVTSRCRRRCIGTQPQLPHSIPGRAVAGIALATHKTRRMEAL